MNGNLDQTGLMKKCRYGSRTWFLGVLASSVSLKDCTAVGCVDRGLNCTNRMPGVGGSRNW